MDLKEINFGKKLIFSENMTTIDLSERQINKTQINQKSLEELKWLGGKKNNHSLLLICY